MDYFTTTWTDFYIVMGVVSALSMAIGYGLGNMKKGTNEGENVTEQS